MKRAAIALIGVAVLTAAIPASAQDAEDEAALQIAPDENSDADLEADAQDDATDDLESDTDEPADLESDEDEVAPETAPHADASADSDRDDEEQVEAAPRGPALTFANSFFSWTNALTVHSFAPAAQLSYDPTYVMAFNLTPRFYLTDSTFLWLNQGLSAELTDSNDGTYNREPLLDDTLLDIRQIVSWEGFVFQLQGRLGFPLSKASQAARRILQTGLGVTITRPFPELASFTVSATMGYRRWWATTNVPQTGAAYPGNCVQIEPGQPPLCTQAGGQSTIRDILIGGLSLSVMPLAGLTVSMSGFYMAAYGHELATASVPINGGTETVPDESLTHWRPYTYFSLAVAYDVLPWLNLQLGIQNAGVVAPLYNPNGSVRSPFNTDTQIFLSTTLSLDGVYEQIVGTHEEEELTPEERQRRRQGLAQRSGTTAF